MALDSQINHKYRQNDHFENTIKFEHKEVNHEGQRLASTRVGGEGGRLRGEREKVERESELWERQREKWLTRLTKG